MTTKRISSGPVFLFDVDGTLVDTVYQHVVAWADALARAGMKIPAWRVHRYIGMSGGMFVRALARETNRPLRAAEVEQMEKWHAEAFTRLAPELRPFPGAEDLLAQLSALRVPWAVATSGMPESAAPALKVLGLSLKDRNVVTRANVQRAKPDPDLFVVAAKRIHAPLGRAIVVGDSVWDLLAARRAGALSIGLLTGGYGRDELERAGAYRVYDDPQDLARHLDEMGVRL